MSFGIVSRDLVNFQKILVIGPTVIVSNNGTKCISRIADYWAEFDGWCKFSQSDKVKLIGRVDRGLIDEFLGRIWLREATIEIVSRNCTDCDLVSKFREKLFENFMKYLPQDEGALVLGLTFGVKSEFSRSFYQKILNAGVAHIVAASGYNVVLIGGSLMNVCLWFTRRNRAFVVTLLLLLGYAWICGLQPPMVRAWWMYLIVEAGLMIGRGVKSWWSLLFAVFFTMLFEKNVIYEVSFWLTVSSCFGLIYFEREIFKRMSKIFPESLLSWTGVSVSVSALIGTAPVVWLVFGKLNLVGIVSNILIVPFVPILTGMGFLMLAIPDLAYLPIYAIAVLVTRLIYLFG